MTPSEAEHWLHHGGADYNTECYFPPLTVDAMLDGIQGALFYQSERHTACGLVRLSSNEQIVSLSELFTSQHRPSDAAFAPLLAWSHHKQVYCPPHQSH